MSDRLRKIRHGLPHFVRMAQKVISGKPFGFSFNVSSSCPVNCSCYWRAEGREGKPELSFDETFRFFERKRNEGFVLATWVGGEPLVRPHAFLQELATVMPANWLVTSATNKIPQLAKTTVFVSIDGKDAATHDAVRGMQGLYDRIHRRLRDAQAQFGLQVFIHTVLNRLNHDQIPDILEHWYDSGLAKGVTFSTVTPIAGADPNLLLDDDMRRFVVAELLLRKQQFGRFLAMTPDMIRMYRGSYVRLQTEETCPTARFVESFDADGTRIPKCIFGAEGDCSGCGCVITPTISGLLHPLSALTSIPVLSGMYTP